MDGAERELHERLKGFKGGHFDYKNGHYDSWQVGGIRDVIFAGSFFVSVHFTWRACRWQEDLQWHRHDRIAYVFDLREFTVSEAGGKRLTLASKDGTESIRFSLSDAGSPVSRSLAASFR